MNFKAISVALLSVFAPIEPLMLAVGILILMDLITGLFKAIKLKQALTSNRLKDTIIKMVVYQAGLITGFILETNLLPGIPFVKIVSGLIGTTEGLSIFENIRDATGLDVIEKFKSFLTRK